MLGSSVRLFPGARETTLDTLIPAVAELLEQISESIAIARDNHLAAKTVQTRNINKKRRLEPKWEVDDMVFANGSSKTLYQPSSTLDTSAHSRYSKSNQKLRIIN
jgi:hypothetical protein